MLENKQPIVYFDHAATTLPLKEVAPLYSEVFTKFYANPASVHALGNENARLLEGARRDILTSLKLNDHQVIFTSGATESNNLAIKGYMRRYKAHGNHLIISSIEHPSVMNAVNELLKEGFEATFIPVNQSGKVNVKDIEKAIKKETILISVMAVNNEVGSIQPIKEIVLLKQKFSRIRIHVDAVQAIGKFDLPYPQIDLLTISMHKLGGLKGSGLLIKKKAIDLLPLVNGGGQEYGLRSGTNDLASAVVDAFVIKNALKNITDNRIKVYSIVKPLYQYFESKKEDIIINSLIENPYIVNISLVHKKASVFAEYLSNNGIMVSTHSACSSKLDTGSPTLQAMGRIPIYAKNSLRLSFSSINTLEEVERFIKVFDYGLARIRG